MIETNIAAYKFRQKVEMRWSDCDMLGHVNNSVYLTYAEQGRTGYCAQLNWDWLKHGLILAKVEVNFRKPLLHTDKPFMYVRTKSIGNKSFEMEHVIYDEKGETPELIATIMCVGVMVDYKTGITFPVPEEIKQTIRQFEGREDL